MNQHRSLPFRLKACPDRQWALAGPDVAKRDMEPQLAS